MIKRSLFGLFVLVCFGAFSQDNQYSQFYAAPVYLNPAMAGTKVCPRLSISFRDQWPAIAGTYVSNTISYDQAIKGFGGVGVLLNMDNAGRSTLLTNQLSFVYSYIQPIVKKVTMSLAVEGGMYQKKLNHENLVFPNQIDPKTGVNYDNAEITQDINKVTPDFSAGGLLYGESFFLGFAVHHLTKPSNILYGPTGVLYRKYTAHGGFSRSIGHEKRRKDRTIIRPQFIYQVQGPARELNIGISAKKNALTAGFWYRGKDAGIVYAGVETRKIRFGLSYDVTLSKLNANNSGGAIELSLGYNFRCRSRVRIPRADCPSF